MELQQGESVGNFDRPLSYWYTGASRRRAGNGIERRTRRCAKYVDIVGSAGSLRAALDRIWIRDRQSA
jgi:hypothetical protein